MFWMAYHTGNLLGTYSYSDRLSNFDLIRKGRIGRKGRGTV
jgi:hypothetical protein